MLLIEENREHELAFFKSSNPNFLSRFGTPFLLFLFSIPLRDLIIVGEGETAPVGAAIGLLAETEAEIEEPQSKAASKSSSASPIGLKNLHDVVNVYMKGFDIDPSNRYNHVCVDQWISDPLRELDHSVGSLLLTWRLRLGSLPPWRHHRLLPPPAAAAKATTTSSSSPPLLPGSSVVPFTAMQSDVSKNMIESLFVPMFRVGYPVNTDALDAPYEKVKPKGVTMTALLAKLQGWLLLSILWCCSPRLIGLFAIDLLELLKIEEEMLSAQSRKTVKDTAKRPYSRPAQPITFATFAQDVLQGSA
ncbi:hypothetical protein YC2023_000900 [Brassica napus]